MSGGNSKYTPKDWVKDIIFFIITTVVAYGYILLMLLIFSFMLASLSLFTIEGMMIASAVGTVLVDIWYIVKMIKKYRN